MLANILAHNQLFVANHEYEQFKTDKFPDKNLVVLACMDARLVELLPRAMGLKNGDFKLIKNAGALVSHPWGSAMRSLIVALYELRAQEVCVIGHTDCGMNHLNADAVLAKMVKRGVSAEKLNTLRGAGINLDQWLEGFDDVKQSVRHSVELIKQHPLITEDVPIHGLIIDPETGALTVVIDGYHRKTSFSP